MVCSIISSDRLLGSEPEMNNLEALLLSTACRPTISLQTSLSETVKGRFGRQVILKVCPENGQKTLFLPLSSSQVCTTGQIRQKAPSLYGELRRQHDQSSSSPSKPQHQAVLTSHLLTRGVPNTFRQSLLKTRRLSHVQAEKKFIKGANPPARNTSTRSRTCRSLWPQAQEGRGTTNSHLLPKKLRNGQGAPDAPEKQLLHKLHLIRSKGIEVA